MSRLNDLIRQVAKSDEALADDLKQEVKALAARRSFGLNFERHVPESVELPGRQVRRGDKVRILPPRGETPKKADERLWRVVRVGPAAEADLSRLDAERDEVRTASIEDLVVVAEFRDPIYPGLVSMGSIERGGGKPFHSVINAENYHALQALLFTHRGKVDAIYIDPPYNTRDRDWKYNNDYVDKDDSYRHSKWLAMMERRLQLARDLLNPRDSVLIVTIDEREVHRLGLLLAQLFPQESAQMVSIVISPLGQERKQQLSRVEEYAFFLFFGDAEPPALDDDLLNETHAEYDEDEEVAPRWERLLRGGADATRRKSPDLFYPVFIDPESKAITSVGDPINIDADRSSVTPPPGEVAVWPIRKNGSEGRWRCSPKYLRELKRQGFAKVGTYNQKRNQWTVLYLGKAQIARVESGEIAVLGRNDEGSVQLGKVTSTPNKISPKTVWHRSAHKAGKWGTELLSSFLPGRSFPYPKSLYAVEDALRIAVGNKVDALVVDFFSGSGTTSHAVMRLNRQDEGHRYSISITNNEVSADEERQLRREGSRPGDSEWEATGICEYITIPRLEAAVTGLTPEGDTIQGDYRFTDLFPMSQGFEENVEFFSLTYEAPLRVASDREFQRIAPLLWLRAGSVGRRIDDVSGGWSVAEAYGVLADLDFVELFLEAVRSNPGVRIAFIVTDEDRLFETVSGELPDHVEPVRLYESYLRNFEIAAARSAR